MRVMVIVKATESSEKGIMPTEALMAAMGKFNEELVNAGIMQSGDGLKPSSAGVRVRFSGEKRIVSDGPFAETKELIAGFWIWNVANMEEAIEWVKRCPNPMMEDSDIEIRPFFEAADFGEVFTPELREQEASIRARTMGLQPPQFKDHDTMVVAGMAQTYNFETRKNIPLQWETFVGQSSSIPNQTGKTHYGICWNTQDDCSFDYLTGVAVENGENLPQGMTHLVLPAGRYAIFQHEGHVWELPQTMDLIWTKWAPECGLNLADAPCVEHYTEAFCPEQGKGGIEIWVAIESD